MDARSDRNIGLSVRRPSRAIVSIFVSLAVLFTSTPIDFAWPNIDFRSSAISTKELHPDTFAIPEYMGRIKNSWNAGPDAPVVIHIQDAHCNYGAQKRIGEIVDYVRTGFGVKTINMEGGAGRYDMSALTSIDDSARRAQISDRLVKDGLVNGVEDYAINNPDKVTLWGIEDPELYLRNLNVYRKSLDHKAEIDAALKDVSYFLSSLKVKIYSKELIALDLKYSQYKAGNIDFRDYLAYMLESAKKSDRIGIVEFSNIDLLSKALEAESNINFRRANVERDELVRLLEKKLSKSSLADLVEKTNGYKAEKISQKAYYGYLMEKVKMVDVDIEDMPELSKYIKYVSIYDSVDKSAVMDEMDRLYAKLINLYAANDDQRQLAKLSRNFAILKNIFNITLTRDDYRYYRTDESAFDVNNFSRFIEANAVKFGIETKFGVNAGNIDGYRKEIAEFYDYSFKRDDAFIKNIRYSKDRIGMSSGKNAKPKSAMLVTGGFHSDNLCELLKKNGISYISIIPNFTNPDGYESPYFKLLVGNPYVEYTRIAQSYGISAIATASPFTELIEWVNEYNKGKTLEQVIMEDINRRQTALTSEQPGNTLPGQSKRATAFTSAQLSTEVNVSEGAVYLKTPDGIVRIVLRSGWMANVNKRENGEDEMTVTLPERESSDLLTVTYEDSFAVEEGYIVVTPEGGEGVELNALPGNLKKIIIKLRIRGRNDQGGQDYRDALREKGRVAELSSSEYNTLDSRMPLIQASYGITHDDQIDPGILVGLSAEWSSPEYEARREALKWHICGLMKDSGYGDGSSKRNVEFFFISDNPDETMKSIKAARLSLRGDNNIKRKIVLFAPKNESIDIPKDIKDLPAEDRDDLIVQPDAYTDIAAPDIVARIAAGRLIAFCHKRADDLDTLNVLVDYLGKISSTDLSDVKHINDLLKKVISISPLNIEQDFDAWRGAMEAMATAV